MSRCARVVVGGAVYHAYDRGNRRSLLFEVPDEYDLFLGLLGDARRRSGTELLAFCLMPNHWHLVLRPETPAGLRDFVAALKQKHTARWHSVRRTWGEGRIYQGRFHARHLGEDEDVLTCLRYVERNALTANLVPLAEDWPWGSLWHRVRGDPDRLLDPPPVPLPGNWVDIVNARSG